MSSSMAIPLASADKAAEERSATRTAARSGAGAGAGAGAGDAGADGATTSMPKLPVPGLDASCEFFEETISPLLTHKEQEELREQLNEMKAEGGVGRQLQALLEERAKTTDSWLEEFWYNSYLRYRAPLPANVSPFFILEDDPTPSRNSQSARATSLILSTLKFFMVVKAGRLEPDIFHRIPLCMSQYKNLFHATRLPGLEQDEPVTFPESRHILVISRAQFYWFNVLTEEGTLCLSPDHIARNLRAIREHSLSASRRTNAKNAVGILTSDRRDTWHKVRTRLAAQGDANKESLHVIDSALFVVCLDDFAPDTLSASSANCLTGTSEIQAGTQVGTCLNRWFDKSLQIIVCANGAAGILFEHSMFDGHTVLRFASDVFTDTILRFAQTIHSNLPSIMEKIPTAFSETDSAPRRIVWELTPDLHHSIRRAEAQFSDLISKTETVALEFGGFGKQFIVSHNLSPDALVQLSFQLAYYDLYGELKNTYETVMTKHFLHGRTEAARPATSEALALGHTFGAAVSTDAKINALRAAVKAQVKFVKRCAKGLGSERHFFGLQCLAERHNLPLPSLLKGKAWKLVNHNTLSTSNCGNPSLRLFGFAPVVEDGYGIGYIIKRDGIQFSVSSRRRQTQRFVDTLERVLVDLQSLLESESQVPVRSSGPAGSLPLATPHPSTVAPHPSRHFPLHRSDTRKLSAALAQERAAASPHNVGGDARVLFHGSTTPSGSP